ncbi:hypothetical protein C8F01DRAFT_1166621 [Mycena amicta]|nr:hypothetical protein C8F01DRAFT_1166621 [Mycena amicta]
MPHLKTLLSNPRLRLLRALLLPPLLSLCRCFIARPQIAPHARPAKLFDVHSAHERRNEPLGEDVQYVERRFVAWCVEGRVCRRFDVGSVLVKERQPKEPSSPSRNSPRAY